MDDPKKLKKLGNGIKLLYVEDDIKLRETVNNFFRKFFTTMYTAKDGLEALTLFKKHSPQLVVTDLNMPNLDGMELIKQIKALSSKTRIIVISAYDNRDYLMQCVNLGVYKFIKKPIHMLSLLEALQSAAKEIREEKNKEFFISQQNTLLDNQSALVAMLDNNKLIMANKVFLDFFHIGQVAEFNEKYKTLSSLFLQREGYLYDDTHVDWLDKITSSQQNIFNVEIKDPDGISNHFILTYKHIPEDNTHIIVSLDNISELNMCPVTPQDINLEQKKERTFLLNLLNILKDNNAKLEMHNYYKGLSITNFGHIIDVNDDFILLKTTSLQLKAIQTEKKTVIVAESLLHSLLCEDMIQISFSDLYVKFKTFDFTTTSPIERKNIRIVPDSNCNIALFINDHQYTEQISIEDITVESVKLKVFALPAGIHNTKNNFSIHITLTNDTHDEPVVIKANAKYLREHENDNSYSIVFMLDVNSQQKNALIKYIAKQQLALIREFKGLKNDDE